ncbi:uracil phosphoribosyltransferase [Gammaproteobacteria bacterium]|nr:uracil phosphoribosyltransferase [Gammaproteobacteria bacterium]
MKIHNLSDQPSVVNNYLKEIRSKEIQKDSMRFRRNVERVGEILAYEISKTLDYKTEEVETPLAMANVKTIDDNIVIVSVLRAALPFHTGFQNCFDKAGSAFISAYRTYKDEAQTEVDIHVEYFAAPDLTGKTIMLVDPMIATGGSLLSVYKAMRSHGKPGKVIIAGLISSEYAIEKIEEELGHTKIELWTAAIDPELDDHAYIVPGLGDAGDLAYGEKL